MVERGLTAGSRSPSLMTAHDCGAYKSMARLTVNEMVVYSCWKKGYTMKGTRIVLSDCGMGHVGLRSIKAMRCAILIALDARDIHEAIKHEDARGVRI